jgi:hypothetical protein
VICTITGDALAREVNCIYSAWVSTLFPHAKRCITNHVDFSSYFESEKHFFSGTATQKYELKMFQINHTPKIDFIPLDILEQYPNLNGLLFHFTKIPIIKPGFFKSEFHKIEYLFLRNNDLEIVEPNALENLENLVWISIGWNKLQTLSYKLFDKNPKLNYIDLRHNKINAIQSNFFDGLNNLMMIEFAGNPCNRGGNAGCPTCRVYQSDINKKFQTCFAACSYNTICQTSYVSHQSSQLQQTTTTTTIRPIETTTKSTIENDVHIFARNIQSKNATEEFMQMIDLSFNEISYNMSKNFESASQEALQKLVQKLDENSGIIEEKIENQAQNFFTTTEDLANKCTAAIDNSVKKLNLKFEETAESNKISNQECCQLNQKAFQLNKQFYQDATAHFDNERTKWKTIELETSTKIDDLRSFGEL